MDHKNAHLFDISHKTHKDHFSKQIRSIIIGFRWLSSFPSIYFLEVL